MRRVRSQMRFEDPNQLRRADLGGSFATTNASCTPATKFRTPAESNSRPQVPLNGRQPCTAFFSVLVGFFYLGRGFFKGTVSQKRAIAVRKFRRNAQPQPISELPPSATAARKVHGLATSRAPPSSPSSSASFFGARLLHGDRIPKTRYSRTKVPPKCTPPPPVESYQPSLPVALGGSVDQPGS